MPNHALVAAGLMLFCSGMYVGQVVRASPTVVVVPGAAPAPAPAHVEYVPMPPPPVAYVPALPALPATIWGASVREVSSQWGSDDWSAKRALGAPDVYPASGDQVNAWASLGADDRTELLEVGLERAARVSAVEVYETFNPGAVTQLELVTASGARSVVYRARAEQLGSATRVLRADIGCTSEPIVAVRVTIDSRAVEGWNEIDAIGVVPCAE